MSMILANGFCICLPIKKVTGFVRLKIQFDWSFCQFGDVSKLKGKMKPRLGNILNTSTKKMRLWFFSYEGFAEKVLYFMSEHGVIETVAETLR